MASSSPRDIKLLLHRSRDVLPQSALGWTVRGVVFGWVAENLVMCCIVLDDGRKYGEPAIGV